MSDVEAFSKFGMDFRFYSAIFSQPISPNTSCPSGALCTAPAKEPPADQKMQKEMMAYWFKKQEEEKRIAEDDEIAWNGSEWADPKALKTAFQGLKDLKIR